ncbi:plus-3-domain-containing protein [Annulohypoxylon bovei var. microspora]|nr:plus-3-domain-containing protein [Annulohypoxylon bovei var. microspora]
MADLDEEILAIVGGDDDESSNEEVEQDLSRSASRSPDPDVKKQTAKETKQKSSRRKQDDSDEEEGEASSGGSPASQDSAPMDESDSDDDAFQSTNTNGKVDDDDDNKYPVDGIYASEAEKDEILAMPELEREQLLAKRQEQVDRQRQNTLLRQLLLKTREDDSQPDKKRKASSADLDDPQRKTSRQRTRVGGSKVGETSAGIESLRRARAEKSDRLRRREEDRERNKNSYSASRNSPDRDGDDDTDDGYTGASRDRHSKSRSPEIKEIPFADLRDIERIRLGRTRFAQVCFYPGFNEAITGCYVRVSLGPGPDSVPVYRMAIIKGFTQGKPYAMSKSNGQTFVTDQYIKAAHGKSERDWPFIICSDSSFTDAEFNRYKKVCQEEGVIFPKRPTLDAKIDDINALMNHTWTNTEVNAKIERERALLSKFHPTERNRLLKLVEEAKHRGDDARVSELQDQLDSLETPRLAFKTSLTSSSSKPTSSGPSQQERLAALNVENRRRNVEAVRKAQMSEKAKSRQFETRIVRGEDADEDTSRRLRTKTNGGSPDQKSTPINGSGASTPANGTPKQNATTKLPMLPHLQKLQAQNHQTGKDKKGIPQIHKPIVDDDIIAALDLDIEVDID